MFSGDRVTISRHHVSLRANASCLSKKKKKPSGNLKLNIKVFFKKTNPKPNKPLGTRKHTSEKLGKKKKTEL